MEILKDLLKKVFDAPLNRLEKRSALQMQDLVYEKKSYAQQGKLLDSLCKVKIKPITKKKPILKRERSADTMRRINTFKNPLNKNREKTPDLNHQKINDNKTRNKTPNLKSKSGIPSYMMGTANSQKNKKEPIHNHYYNLRKQREEDVEKDKKISLTPEPKKKKNTKKKNIDNNINDNSQLNVNNINVIQNDDLNDKKSDISNSFFNNNEFELNNNERNLKNTKQENEILKSPFEKKKEDINFGNILNLKENEKIKIINIIISFLNQKEKMDFILTNKKFLPNLLSIIETYKYNIENKYEIISITTIENRKQILKNKFPNLNTSELPNYDSSNTALKKFEYLTSNLDNKIFHEKNLTSEQEKIIIIYRIFLQLIKQSEISNIKDNKEFWIKCCNYINENSKGKTGDFFKDSLNYFDFSAENIFKIKNMIVGNEDSFTNNRYATISPTTSFVALFIKDALEFVGVLNNEVKNNKSYLYRNLEYLEFVYVKITDYIKRLENAINSNK